MSKTEPIAWMRVGANLLHGYEMCAADDPNGFPVVRASAPGDDREGFESFWEDTHGARPKTWNQVCAEYHGLSVPSGAEDRYYMRATQDAWGAWKAGRS